MFEESQMRYSIGTFKTSYIMFMVHGMFLILWGKSSKMKNAQRFINSTFDFLSL